MEDNNGKNARGAEETYLPDELITHQVLPWLPIKPLIQCDLFLEIMKHPGKLASVRFSCDLYFGDFKQLIGFTKAGKVFITRSNPGVLGLLDQCSKETLVTFDDQLLLIESYVPTQSSPHPAAELPNEPAEGTWPEYQVVL
ncbi:uncharacterized protein LOC110725608 [Chenopodium quinoa]|uniref:uncharacterized protein LOC110725608 n=1 Tax=Chenopodium quinoa TaxID=63459 RepID=UPI000B773EF7|nr:uncharacterized protein LOC110725608 [Chenopodium quinoa]